MTQHRGSARCAIGKLRVFCEEYNTSHANEEHARHFIVTTYKVCNNRSHTQAKPTLTAHLTRRQFMWKSMMKRPAAQRHFYEVIREQHPCHLHFDLEFSTSLNPKTNGTRCVHVLLGQLHQLFRCSSFVLAIAAVVAQTKLVSQDCLVHRTVWDLELLPMHVLELDSTTPHKFSRHLLIRIPGYAFSNNQVCLNTQYMLSIYTPQPHTHSIKYMQVIQTLLHMLKTNYNQDAYLVKSPHDQCGTFIDEGIYTRYVLHRPWFHDGRAHQHSCALLYNPSMPVQESPIPHGMVLQGRQGCHSPAHPTFYVR
jgi:hypothetical protein